MRQRASRESVGGVEARRAPVQMSQDQKVTAFLRGGWRGDRERERQRMSSRTRAPREHAQQQQRDGVFPAGEKGMCACSPFLHDEARTLLALGLNLHLLVVRHGSVCRGRESAVRRAVRVDKQRARLGDGVQRGFFFRAKKGSLAASTQTSGRSRDGRRTLKRKCLVHSDGPSASSRSTARWRRRQSTGRPHPPRRRTPPPNRSNRSRSTCRRPGSRPKKMT